MSLLTGLCTFLTGQGLAQNTPADPEDMFFQAPWDGSILGTGVRRPTAEQWAWGEEHMVKTKKVKLNKLGLARINHARAQRGEQPLPDNEAEVVADGAEVVGAASGSVTTETTPSAPAALPAYVDNSTLNYFPPIRSQGSLGSCAQFSSVYYTLTHMTAMARNWDAKNGGDNYRFSPKWTYNMLNGGANAGTWHYDAYAIAQKHGLATWAEFPYDGNYLTWCMNPAVWRNAISMRADKTGKVLDVDTDTGLSQLKQLLVNGYVLNFATYINSWQWKAIGNDAATTADDLFAGKQCVYQVNGTSGGHAMTIVGFNDDIWVDINGDGLVSANEKGALRIANSWGTSWGEAGFCWISYQALRTRNAAKTSEGVFWYDEATWVTARPSYEPKAIAEFTLNHAKRNQIIMSLGVSDTSSTTPSTTWYPNKVLYSAGGAYAFNGTTTPCDATFCLDLTDLVPTTVTAKRYYLGLFDSTTGDVAALKSYLILDLTANTQTSCDGVPLNADASQTYAAEACAIGNSTQTDFDPPIVGILSPANGAQITGTTTLNCTASDNVGVTAVTLYVDGAAKQTLTQAPYDFSWDSTTVADGSHTLGVAATDAAGNASQTTVSVTVKNALADTTPPVIAITSPSSGYKITTTSVTVKVSATDNVGVAKVAFYVDNKLTTTSTTSPFSFNWNTKKLAAGSHTICCVAYDAAGNSAMSPVVTVTK